MKSRGKVIKAFTQSDFNTKSNLKAFIDDIVKDSN